MATLMKKLKQPGVKPAVKLVVDAESLESLANEYEVLKEQEKAIKKRKDAIAAVLKEEAESRGSRNDTGTYSLDAGSFIISKQARKSVSFKQKEAVEWLKTQGFGAAVAVVETVNEKAVENLVASGDVDINDLEPLTEVKVVYAIDVKRKEEIPEAEQAYFSASAARRKVK
jgi:hypothetical protein